ncbi:hypothetical protein HN51_052751 [Arachis hypogaea]
MRVERVSVSVVSEMCPTRRHDNSAKCPCFIALIHLLPYSFEQTRPASTKGKTLAATTTARRSCLCRRPLQSGACLLESSCVAIRGVSSKSSICSQSQVAGAPFLPRARWPSSCRHFLSPSIAVRGLSSRVFVHRSQGSSSSPRFVHSPRRRLVIMMGNTGKLRIKNGYFLMHLDWEITDLTLQF